MVIGNQNEIRFVDSQKKKNANRSQLLFAMGTIKYHYLPPLHLSRN